MAELNYTMTKDTLFKLYFVKYPDLLKNLVESFAQYLPIRLLL